MSDQTIWMPVQTPARQTDIHEIPDDYPHPAPSGWWILPAAVSGALGWFAILSLVF